MNLATKDTTLAVITARGGSQRIKKKNIRIFHGKPIIAYSIQTAIDCRLFDRIIVTTDSDEIARISEGYGAEVPFTRDACLADDYVGTVEVVRDAVDKLDPGGRFYNHVCCIYPTAPFLSAKYLRKGYQILGANDIDYVFSAAEHAPSVYHSLQKTDAGGVTAVFNEYISQRTQDLPAAYYDAGQFYWGTAKAFRLGRPIFSQRSRMVVLPSRLVCDINSEEDWRKAEVMYRNLQEKGC